MTKGRGHFCWCCAGIRANPRFSGRGHVRHLCKDCQKLGGDELAYRQAVRNIDGMIPWETGCRRRQRANFADVIAVVNWRRLWAALILLESGKSAKRASG